MSRWFLVCALAVLPSLARAAVLPADLHLETVIGANAGIAQPMVVTHAGDGSGRLFVAGRAGKVWIKPPGEPVLATAFLDIEALISTAGEGGLLGLAFHPEYAVNGRFFVSYTDGENDTVLARYEVSGADADVADPASATVLLRVDQGSSTHKGGDLHFGPDGFLYFSLGDGAEGFGLDDCGRSQSLSLQDVLANESDTDCTLDAGFTGNPASRALMGKLLRLDVDLTSPAGAEMCGGNADGSANYGVPAANPFAGTRGGAGRCDEIFAYGLRNPFRFGIDPANGAIFIGDVGESDMEEVDVLDAAETTALDFGWPRCEGTLGDCDDSVAPILVDDRGAGSCAITGGTVYRGAITAMQGLYVYSDYCTGQLRFASETGGTWTAFEWPAGAGGFGQHVCFGTDEAGEMYVCEVNADKVKRFASALVGPLFADGFETP